MKKLIVLFTIISALSCKNQIKEIEIDKKGGEWVSSGEKFLIGSDEQVQAVKNFISNYDAMDAEAIFLNTRDSLRFFAYNSEEPVIVTYQDVQEMFSQYDSIISSPIYFLPYELDGVRRIVEVGTNEIKYKKDGIVEKDFFLEKYIFGEDDKIHTVRQWRAAW